VLKAHQAVYCYSCPSGSVNLPALFEHAISDKQTVLNAGGSVTISAMTIAMALGMSSLHIFGFDCHVGQAAYATGITGVGVDHPAYLEIDVGERAFTTTGAYLSFAQQFFPLMETAKAMGYVTAIQFYGDSLVMAMGSEWLDAMNLTKRNV